MTHDQIPGDEPEERVTPEWKASVKKWLAEQERPQAFLAREAGCDPSLISLLLNTAQASSSVARRISEVTGVPLPQEPVDEEERRLLKYVRAARARNPKNLRTIEGLAKLLADGED